MFAAHWMSTFTARGSNCHRGQVEFLTSRFETPQKYRATWQSQSSPVACSVLLIDLLRTDRYRALGKLWYTSQLTDFWLNRPTRRLEKHVQQARERMGLGLGTLLVALGFWGWAAMHRGCRYAICSAQPAQEVAV